VLLVGLGTDQRGQQLNQTGGQPQGARSCSCGAPSTVSVLVMAFCSTLGAVLGTRNIFLISSALLAVGATLAWRQFQRATQLRGVPHTVFARSRSL
jgi:hypothetical protein